MTDADKVREAISVVRRGWPQVTNDEIKRAGQLLADRVEELERELARLRRDLDMAAEKANDAVNRQIEYRQTEMTENAKLRAAIEAVRDARDEFEDQKVFDFVNYFLRVDAAIEKHVLPLTEGRETQGLGFMTWNRHSVLKTAWHEPDHPAWGWFVDRCGDARYLEYDRWLWFKLGWQQAQEVNICRQHGSYEPSRSTDAQQSLLDR